MKALATADLASLIHTAGIVRERALREKRAWLMARGWKQAKPRERSKLHSRVWYCELWEHADFPGRKFSYPTAWAHEWHKARKQKPVPCEGCALAAVTGKTCARKHVS